MKIITTILLLGFYSLVFGQNTLTGIITNQNNDPIFGANIYIENLSLGTTSNEYGFYQISNIPRGNHNITCSLIGFQTLNYTIEFSSNDQKNTILNY